MPSYVNNYLRMNACDLGSPSPLSIVETTNQYSWVCTAALHQQKEEVYMRLGLSRS